MLAVVIIWVGKMCTGYGGSTEQEMTVDKAVGRGRFCRGNNAGANFEARAVD